MSQENVEIVRKIYAALSRGDIEGALQAGVDDVEHDWSRSVGPYQGVYRGREEARALWQGFIDAMDELAFDLEKARTVGPHVVAFVSVRMRGRASGVEVVAKGPHLWTLRDGKVITFRLFQENSEALEAVGLSE